MNLSIPASEDRLTTVLFVKSAAECVDAIEALLQEDWRVRTALRAAALHGNMSADSVVEYAQWDAGAGKEASERAERLRGKIHSIAPEAEVSVDAFDVISVRPGRGHEEGGFYLSVDLDHPRPTLIGVFEPESGSYDELLDYLNEASVRLAAVLEGWIGAVLHRRADGRDVVLEYLQFEDMDAVGATQGSAQVGAHQERLHTFGAVKVDLYQLRQVFKP